MTLQQLKREIQSLKETVKDRPLHVLLNCKNGQFTDSELARFIKEVPLKQIPTNALLQIQNRVHETDFKFLQDIPAEYLEKMRKEYLESVPSEVETRH